MELSGCGRAAGIRSRRAQRGYVSLWTCERTAYDMRMLVASALWLFGDASVAGSPTGVPLPKQQPPPTSRPLRGAHSVEHLGDLPDGPPWPELGATPMLAYNGWLASTEFMGYNNETLYYKLVDQLVASNLSAAGYDTIVRGAHTSHCPLCLPPLSLSRSLALSLSRARARSLSRSRSRSRSLSPALTVLPRLFIAAWRST